MPDTPAVFDAIVVGAGPAGSAVARRLAQRGRHVALLERSRFETSRIGESLPPDVQEPLRDLGVWTEFLALSPLPSWGTCSVWGDATPRSQSHVFNPYGCGWHVDRRAFDRVLARAAAAAGAVLFEGTSLTRCEYRCGDWQLRTTSTEAPQRDLRARVLIDASGRRAQVARSLGTQRVLLDRLVGIDVCWSGVDVAERSHLLVETTRDGWWYSAPLPGDDRDATSMVAVLMTDADLCGTLRLAVDACWRDVLRSTHATRRRLRAAQAISAPHVHGAYSHRLRRDTTHDFRPWLAVGDAALAVDPVSGSGVLRALRTARAAAETVDELLTQSHAAHDALAAYENERDRECTAYLFERAQYYAAERRFDSPFWQRRHRSQESHPA